MDTKNTTAGVSEGEFKEKEREKETAVCAAVILRRGLNVSTDTKSTWLL